MGLFCKTSLKYMKNGSRNEENIYKKIISNFGPLQNKSTKGKRTKPTSISEIPQHGPGPGLEWSPPAKVGQGEAPPRRARPWGALAPARWPAGPTFLEAVPPIKGIGGARVNLSFGPPKPTFSPYLSLGSLKRTTSLDTSFSSSLFILPPTFPQVYTRESGATTSSS